MNFYLKNCKYISWNDFRAPNIGGHTLAQLCARVAPMSHGGHKNEADDVTFSANHFCTQLWQILESVQLQIRFIKFYEERNVTSWCRFTFENISPLFMCNIQEGAKNVHHLVIKDCFHAQSLCDCLTECLMLSAFFHSRWLVFVLYRQVKCKITI